CLRPVVLFVGFPAAALAVPDELVRAGGVSGAELLRCVEPETSGAGLDDDVLVDDFVVVGAGSGFGAAVAAPFDELDGYGSGLGPAVAAAGPATSAATARTRTVTAARLRAAAGAGYENRARPSESRRSRNVISALTSSPARFIRSSPKLLPVVREVNTRGPGPPAPEPATPYLVSLRHSISSLTYLSIWLFD